MSRIYYTGSQQEVETANEQIDSNCSFPDDYTQSWYLPRQAYQQNFWFMIKPPARGYKEPHRSFTQAQMIAGIVNVQEQESQPNWWPPREDKK